MLLTGAGGGKIFLGIMGVLITSVWNEKIGGAHAKSAMETCYTVNKR